MSLGFFQKCGALAIVYYLRNQASHIDIKNVKRTILNAFATSAISSDSLPKLHGHWMFSGVDFHQCFCFIMIGNGFALDHFHSCRSGLLLALAKFSECQICHCHWCKRHKRILHLTFPIFHCIFMDQSSTASAFFFKFLIRDIPEENTL